MDWEKEVADMSRRAHRLATIKPSFPFWLLCKIIWHELRGRRIKIVDLFPPFKIEFVN